MPEQVIPLQAIENRLAAVDQQMVALQMERATLLRLRQLAVAGRVSGPRVEPEPHTNGKRKRGASKAVLQYVRDNPGRSHDQIAGALLGQVETSSANPRRMLMNTVTNLISRGKLTKDPLGGVMMP